MSKRHISRITLFITVSVIAFSYLVAEPYSRILHDPEELIEAVYEAGNLKKEDVTVVIFEYDYLKAQWHIEVMPTTFACIDCYPSFYIENKPMIKVELVPHG